MSHSYEFIKLLSKQIKRGGVFIPVSNGKKVIKINLVMREL